MPANTMLEHASHFSRAEQKVREHIFTLVVKAAGRPVTPAEAPLVYPPATVAGDFALPCFQIGKLFGASPVDTAAMLSQGIQPLLAKYPQLERVEPAGPYVNFYLNRNKFAAEVLEEIEKSRNTYGQAKIGQGKRIMIEYFSPNTNKQLTIGHVRNMLLGCSLQEIFKFLGYKVVSATINNDRGIAIAKVIVAYQKWGEGKTPKTEGMKPDHFVGSLYVRFGQAVSQQPQLDAEAKAVLKKWEAGDKKTIAVWKKLMAWVQAGFSETLARLDVDKFDENYFESEIYTQGRDLVEKGLKKGALVQGEDGVIIAPLEKTKGLPDKVVLRSDGTSVYVTQDIYLASLKAKHKLDMSIYVVGSEQDLYLKQLFAILDLLNLPGVGVTRHLSYGMIRLPDGKIKSREGVVEGTAADDILDELETLAKAEIKKRDPDISKKDLTERARQIGLAAIKFYILQVDPKTTMVFEPQRSIALTGHTGPYLQYVHARINGIFEKAEGSSLPKNSVNDFSNDTEFILVKLLSRFPNTLSETAAKFSPARLADYLYELARAFSAFYEDVPILKGEPSLQPQRLALLKATQTVMRTGLELLGIPTPKKM